MKKSGVYITDTALIFKSFSSKEIGLTMHCKSFSILLKEIKFIVISPRMALDDEVFFILIIGKNNKIYKIPYAYYIADFSELEQHFFSIPIVKELEKFAYEDYYGKIDKIIYPKEYYWQDLFKNNWKLRLRSLLTLLNPKSCFGDFNSHLKS